MTDPHDAAANTRPISVAELLAKNGTIGAPPVGGRRRRRRGNSDSVTVAELTGEIPIFSEATETEHHAPAAPEPAPEPPARPVPAQASPEVERAELDEVADDEAAPAQVVEAEPEFVSGEEADYAAHLQQRDIDPDPIDFAPPSRRTRRSAPKSFSPFPTTAGSTGLVKSDNPAVKVTPPTPQSSRSVASTGFDAPTGGAEQMSPDPVADDDELVDLGPDVDFSEALEEHPPTADEDADEDYELPSYLRSSSDTLFGGQSVADDLARRGLQPSPEDIDLDDADERRAETSEAPEEATSEPSGSAFVRGVWIVAQCILAVAFGAGLFIAFDQLWGWNPIVALVLSVLVILGLVAGVRVVRKTEDIGSTLIAVAVGALVTLGPLALLQSH